MSFDAERWLLTTRRVVGVAFVVTALGGLALWVAYRVWLPGSIPAQDAMSELVQYLPVLAFGVVGLAILRTRLRHPVGWSFAMTGTVAALAAAWSGAEAWSGGEVWEGVLPGWAALVAVGFLTFPTGRLPTRRWRWLLVVIGWSAIFDMLVFAWSFWQAFEPAPVFVSTWMPKPNFGQLPEQLAGVLGPLVVLASLVSIVVRWRRAGGIERLQLKWLTPSVGLFSFVLLGNVAIVHGVLPDAVGTEYDWIGDLLFMGLLASVPISMGIAITRYKLYEIDRLVSRTVSYGIVVAAVVGVYAGVFLGLGALLDLGGDLEVALATLAAIAVSAPILQRTRRLVDLRFFRSHYDASQVISDFASQLKEEIDLVRLVSGVEVAVESSFQPEVTAVWLAEELASDTAGSAP